MRIKGWLCMLLAALLLCVPALAEDGPEGIPQEAVVPEGQAFEADLDGDGAMDSVRWTMEEDEETYEYLFTLEATLADGTALALEPEITMYVEGVYAADLDGDGAEELLLSGDEASDDYITYCLRAINGRLVPAMFADGARGDRNGGYYKCGYGYVSAIDGNRVALCGSQDMLGTWFATRVYALSDVGVFEFADEGKWVRDAAEVDEDTWEYASLTTIAPLPYTTAEGRQAELPVGTKLIIVATDKQYTADFITRDGVEGTLSVMPDEEKGWGMLIDGKSEDEYFDYVPYAD